MFYISIWTSFEEGPTYAIDTCKSTDHGMKFLITTAFWTQTKWSHFFVLVHYTPFTGNLKSFSSSFLSVSVSQPCTLENWKHWNCPELFVLSLKLFLSDSFHFLCVFVGFSIFLTDTLPT